MWYIVVISAIFVFVVVWLLAKRSAKHLEYKSSTIAEPTKSVVTPQTEEVALLSDDEEAHRDWTDEQVRAWEEDDRYHHSYDKR